MDAIRIDKRFCGPPDSGNGGYVAGMLAQALGGADCVVRLKAPPPLARDLTVVIDGDEAQLMDADQLVATAFRSPVSVEVPSSPDMDVATEAETRFSGFNEHAFPTCFVCGPDRAEGDGLRIFTGAVEGDDGQVAAVWRPDASLLNADGHVRPEFIWAALDCPGYFSVQQRAGMAVLGQFGAVIHDAAIAPQPLIVTGWPIESSGRKHIVGTAIHDAGGKLLAAATGTWISLKA